jgi:thiosulfate dehydrogenase [quinone] large subunit
MLALMYSAASILPEHNPFLDDHIIYAVIMVGLIVVESGRHLGLGNMWAKTRLVRNYPILE